MEEEKEGDCGTAIDGVGKGGKAKEKATNPSRFL